MIRWFIGAFFALFFHQAWCLTDAELLQISANQSAYQRQVVWLNPQATVQSNRIAADIVFCAPPYPCIPAGNWNFEVNDGLKQDAAAQMQTWLAIKRLDKLQVDNQGLTLTTALATVNQTAKLSAFRYPLGSFSSYSQALENYLQDQIASPLHALLAKSLAVRYQERKNQEAGTFAVDEAKSQGLNRLAIEDLMDDTYAMGVYLQEVKDAKVSITLERYQDAYGRTRVRFVTSVNIPLRLQLKIWRFNPQQKTWQEYQTLSGFSGYGVRESSVYDLRPTNPRSIETLYRTSFQSAMKAAILDLNQKLKADANFALAAPIKQVDDLQLQAAMDNSLDLRIDMPFVVQRSIDGEMQTQGWAKLRQAAVATKDPQQEVYSTLALVQGEAQTADRLLEVPWLGMDEYFGVSWHNFTFDPLNNLAITPNTQSLLGLTYGRALDWGFLNNDADDSEFWTHFQASLLLAGDEATWGTQTYQSPMGLSWTVDYGKRWFLGSSGAYLNWSGGLDGSILAFNGSNQTTAGLTYAEMSLSTQLRLGYHLSAQDQIALHYHLPLAQLYGDVQLDGQPVQDGHFSHDSSIFLVYIHPLNNVGSMANFVSD